jgi:hypothetical protein
METIALVACVKSKRTGHHQAKDLYNSTLFTYSRRYAELHADRWFILSAKHGLLDPSTMLESYEGTLKNVAPKIKQRWAQKVYEQIMALNLDTRNVRILWLAGNDYKSALSPMLSRFIQVDPVRGLKLGPRMAWLKAHLGEENAETAIVEASEEMA